MKWVYSLERVTGVAGFIGAVILLPLTGSMVYEVLSRYFFDRPTSWAYELSYMMMAAIFVLGIAYALKHRQHVNVDLIYNHLPPRGKATINLLGYLVLFPTMVWLAYALYQHAARAFMTGQTSGISSWNPYIWPVRAVLSVGIAVFAIQILVDIVKNLRAFAENDGREI